MKKANTPQISTRQSVSITKQELHIRPLPAPEELQHYEAVQPGFANRLLVMAEKEQDRRLTREDNIIKLQNKSMSITTWGLILGFFSVIVIAALCGYIAYLGDTKAAAAVASVVIATLAAVFVTRRFTQSKNSKSEE